MKALAVAGAALLVLAGCGAIQGLRQTQAINEIAQSKAAYKECLRNHPADTSACGALREIFEADLRAFRAMTGGTVTIEEE